METSREEPSTSRIHVSTVGLGKCHYPLKPPSGFCGIRTRDLKSQPDLPRSDPGKGGASTTKPPVPQESFNFSPLTPSARSI